MWGVCSWEPPTPPAAATCYKTAGLRCHLLAPFISCPTFGRKSWMTLVLDWTVCSEGQDITPGACLLPKKPGVGGRPLKGESHVPSFFVATPSAHGSSQDGDGTHVTAVTGATAARHQILNLLSHQGTPDVPSFASKSWAKSPAGGPIRAPWAPEAVADILVGFSLASFHVQSCPPPHLPVDFTVSPSGLPSESVSFQ